MNKTVPPPTVTGAILLITVAKAQSHKTVLLGITIGVFGAFFSVINGLHEAMHLTKRAPEEASIMATTISFSVLSLVFLLVLLAGVMARFEYR